MAFDELTAVITVIQPPTPQVRRLCEAVSRADGATVVAAPASRSVRRRAGAMWRAA